MTLSGELGISCWLALFVMVQGSIPHQWMVSRAMQANTLIFAASITAVILVPGKVTGACSQVLTTV